MARTTKDATVAAQEAADLAKRKADRLEAKVAQLTSDLEAAKVEHATAKNLAEHAANHPLLVSATATSETQSGADAGQPVDPFA